MEETEQRIEQQQEENATADEDAIGGKELVENEEFERYVTLMESRMDLVDKFDTDFKLRLYSAGKHAKYGECNTP